MCALTRPQFLKKGPLEPKEGGGIVDEAFYIRSHGRSVRLVGSEILEPQL
jgi:hypothetical protein